MVNPIHTCHKPTSWGRFFMVSHRGWLWLMLSLPHWSSWSKTEHSSGLGRNCGPIVKAMPAIPPNWNRQFQVHNVYFKSQWSELCTYPGGHFLQLHQTFDASQKTTHNRMVCQQWGDGQKNMPNMLNNDKPLFFFATAWKQRKRSCAFNNEEWVECTLKRLAKP